MPFLKSHKKRVLVVDDDPLILDVTSEFLQNEGFETVTAPDTLQALDEMKRHPAHVMLLDIKLPNESGLEFLAKFKEQYPDVPVVMLTGSGYDEDMMQEALNKGASGYVSKETDLENMVVAVKRLIK